MRALAPWLVGSVFAFLLASAAFLLLANLGTEPSEVRLEQREPPPRSSSPLELELREDQLSSMNARPDQSMTLGVRNGGEEVLSDVNLTVEVYPEDTSVSDARRHRKTVRELRPGESAEVPFELDLSPPSGTSEVYPGPEPPRTIVEVRATTPEGTSAIRTAILQP